MSDGPNGTVVTELNSNHCLGIENHRHARVAARYSQRCRTQSVFLPAFRNLPVNCTLRSAFFAKMFLILNHEIVT
jgi:hypothetical protein